MNEIAFLTKDQILHLHRNAIRDYGGSDSIRDINMLDSALAQPKATFDGKYLHGNIYLMASAYFFHISQNQPFMDGNKRTGLLAMYTFLRINGFLLDTENEIIYPILLQVAEGRLDKDDLASFIKQHNFKYF
jgi:death on curing protein